ncbi:MAG: hypothetical protein GX343_02425 [Erysipelotrichaceae bacterium]|jgi:hypothetical protein|nr:hypothetical protein [Bacillota bacterium]MDY0117974.1 hypothetical protein [Bacilli bacterium]NLJ32673.1 hypothetical protein [Erysipelotrichaceae bacterium]
MVKWMDNLPKWAKVVLALPCLDVVWVIYRLVKSLGKKQTLGVVLAVILIVVGLPWLWLLDIITIILLDKVLWF